jgi:outer membrane protein OmpA-like peptidoglycan-associated protein
MRHLVQASVLLPVLLLATSGCATKHWVREMLGAERTQSDDRFGAVETRVGDQARQIAAVDGRLGREAERLEGMGGKLRSLEESVGVTADIAKVANERADKAHSRAEGAYARANEVDNRLTRLWKNRHKRTLVDMAQVRFGFDRADLDDAAQTALAALIKELKENPELSVDLEGYTDTKGPREYNVHLSQRRVEAVRRYLVSQGVELPRIHAIGLGPIPEKDTTDEGKRRVSVKLTIHPD